MAKRKLNIIETNEEVNNESVQESIAEIRTEENATASKAVKENLEEKKPTVSFECKVSVEGYLNVRKGPGIEYDVEKKLPNGVSVRVTETNGDWAKIGTDLWVMKKFLK